MKALNGRVQVSGLPEDQTIGLLVERGELFGGVLMTPAQAQNLADELLTRLRFRQAGGT